MAATTTKLQSFPTWTIMVVGGGHGRDLIPTIPLEIPCEIWRCTIRKHLLPQETEKMMLHDHKSWV
eukprot:CAMPEP_0116853610 /NCGR_PEP_ID=MMETSP0418-20121206/18027_1 /TAXON_ID=1158023 /ORGANISM="Astrosyne radiata, Strain 13vi08-1A" /LENGTH=65 /DNA_ID=CAMNT_0004486069 /DNA_START=124 /DNA_END=318 /DNA_ORIENTATION=-